MSRHLGIRPFIISFIYVTIAIEPEVAENDDVILSDRDFQYPFLGKSITFWNSLLEVT